MNWFTPDPEPYPDAVVSFWRVDEQNEPETLLYVGALIKPNWILVPRDFFLPSETFKNIRIYTGRTFDKMHSTAESQSRRFMDAFGTLQRSGGQTVKNVLEEEKNFIDFKILDKMTIPKNDRFLIVIVSTAA